MEYKVCFLKKLWLYLLIALFTFLNSADSVAVRNRKKRKGTQRARYTLPKKQKIRPVGFILTLKKKPKTFKKWSKKWRKRGFKTKVVGRKKPLVLLTHKKPHFIKRKKWKSYCKVFERLSFVDECQLDMKMQMTQESTTVKTRNSSPTNSSDEDFDYPKNCNLFNYKNVMGYQDRTDLWAQEAIGADLVDQEYNEMAANQLTPVDTYVCDSSEKNHNVYVTNIVNGSSKKSSPTKDWSCRFTSGLKTLVKEIDEKNLNTTTLINYSMGPADYSRPDYFGDKEQFSNILLVGSAGNENLKSLDAARAMTEASKAGKLILIGSLNPVGVPSTFSSQSEEVLLSVPSDHTITSCDQSKEKCVPFGGTSGAAPQVTHGLDKSLGLTPTVSPDKIRELLVNTGIPMPHTYEKVQRNGSGMFNSYKVWSIAKKINQECKNASNLVDCQNQLIEHAKNFDPHKDKILGHEKIEFGKNFPECSSRGVSGKKKVSCSLRRKNFRTLRENAFLSKPNTPFSRFFNEKIACLMGYHDYWDSFYFYSNVARPGQNLSSTSRIIPYDTNENSWVGQLAIARNVQYLKPEVQREYIQKIQESFRAQIKNGRISTQSIIIAAQLGEEGSGILSDFLRLEETQGREYITVFVEAYNRLGPNALDDVILNSDEFSLREKNRILKVAAKLDNQNPGKQIQLIKKFLKGVPVSLSGIDNKSTVDNFYNEAYELVKDIKGHPKLSVEVLDLIIQGSPDGMVSGRSMQALGKHGLDGLNKLVSYDFSKLSPNQKNDYYQTLASFGSPAIEPMMSKFSGTQDVDERNEIMFYLYLINDSKSDNAIINLIPQMNAKERKHLEGLVGNLRGERGQKLQQALTKK